MFYLSISIQFILKMLLIWSPCVIVMVVFITYIRKDFKRIINLFNRIVNI